jgi:hypothetical protein
VGPRSVPVTDGPPTPRTTLHTGYVRVLVFCNTCRRQADAHLAALVESGPGDVPLTELRFRCSQCRTDRTDFVVTSLDSPQPWWQVAELAVSARLRPPGRRGVCVAAQGGVAGGVRRATSGSRAARAATATPNAATAMSSVVMAQISVVMGIRTLPPIG